MACGTLVGTVADVEDDVISVRVYPGYVHLIYEGRKIAIYQASGARALAAVLSAAADRCGDDLENRG